MDILNKLVEAYNYALNDNDIKLILNELIEYLEKIDNEKGKNQTLATLIKNAILELGYIEKETSENINSKYAGKSKDGQDNITKFAEHMDKKETFYKGKKQGQDWCDIFVDYLFDLTFGEKRARELLKQYKPRIRGASVVMSLMYFASYNKNRMSNIVEKLNSNRNQIDPKIGSQIFFQNENKSLVHTGFICAVDLEEGYIYCIEGNASPQSDKVEPKGLGVYLKRYRIDDKRIFYSMRPEFNDFEDINEVQSIKILSIIKKLYETIYKKYLLPIEKQVESKSKADNTIQPSIYGLEKFIKSIKTLKPYLVSFGKVIIEDAKGLMDRNR